MFGLMLFFALGFFALIAIGLASSGGEEIAISKNSVLKLKLNKPIQERSEENPFEDLPMPIDMGNENIGLDDIRKTIKYAKQDPSIEGIYLELSGIGTSFAVLEELRNLLLDFKQTGKFIYAYGQYYDEKAFYLASIADKTFLHPEGFLEFNGLVAEKTYYTNLFKNIGIKPRIFKVGDFKSAVEPYLLEQMSEADRLQTSSYLNSIYDFYLENLSKSLNKDVAELREISNQMKVQLASDAVDLGLIHELGYYDALENEIKTKLELSEKKKIKFVSLSKYIKSVPKAESTSRDKIAIITGEGTIMNGKSRDGILGSKTIVKAIRKARKNKNVKAIILRINSPGGGVIASEDMWREVMLTKKVKPIIASMSGVAASGGYYMAMACDTIVAMPNTITGSIGIFAMLFETSELMEDKIGLRFSRVKTGELADLASPTKPYSEAEAAFFQNRVNAGYETFTSKAAQGRGMEIEDLKKVASGRVWTGSQAKKLGLVDELGGLDRAIEIAAEASGLEDGAFKIVNYPVKKTFLQEFMSQSTSQIKARAMREELGMLYPYFKQIGELKTLEGIQARMPYGLEIH